MMVFHMSKGPVRLAKQETQVSPFIYIKQFIEAWVLSHATLCLIIAMGILITLFIIVMFSIVGISATESGAMRNFINGGYV